MDKDFPEKSGTAGGEFVAEQHFINVGTESFLEGLRESGTSFSHLAWRPPAQGDPELVEILFRLSVNFLDSEGNSLIDKANTLALERICRGNPVLKGVRPAHQYLPHFTKNMLLHAGPPVAWPDMCGPMRGAIIGALKYEGMAHSEDEAIALMDSGKIFYGPTFPHAVVAPMSGVVSYSMPLAEVRNETFGNAAYSPLNEGTGFALRFGVHSATVIAHLQWMERVLAPSLNKAVQALGGVNLKNIMSLALSMGDELHQRNFAATSKFYRTICVELAEAAPDREEELAIMRFLGQTNDQFFLNFGMAACRSLLDPASNLPYSSIVTSMGRNGVDFGIHVSGLGNQWFTGPSGRLKALYLPGYSDKDANSDLGDSSIMECCGLGGFAMASSPAVTRAMREGGLVEALRVSQDMAAICVGRNPDLPIPNLDFAGAPTGIDIRRVVATGILPMVNSGVSHRLPGFGQIGAGHAAAPMECMKKALRTFYAFLREQAAVTL